MTDREFLNALERCTLTTLSHVDHLRAAWLILQQHELMVAIEKLSVLFMNFAVSKGQPNHFHATITWAFTVAIHERMLDGKRGQTWREFVEMNPDLEQGRAFLNQWYSDSQLDSDVARSYFVLPSQENS